MSNGVDGTVIAEFQSIHDLLSVDEDFSITKNDGNKYVLYKRMCSDELIASPTNYTRLLATSKGYTYFLN